VDEEPRACVADLSLVVEDTPRRGLGRRVDVRAVGHHDVRRLAAALEREPLHVRLAGVAQEELADLRRAGEGDEVHVHVPADRLTGRLAEAGDDLQHARRHPRLRRQLGEPQRGERRLLGRLQHDAVAGGERRAELPRRHQQREVPGHDRADDSYRLAHDHHDRGRIGRRNLVVDLVDRLPVVRDALGGKRDVDLARVADRLAHVECLEQCELVAVLVDECGQPLEDALAVLRRTAGPHAALERRTGAANGAVDVVGVAGGNLGEDLARRRVDALERLAAQRIDVGAVDERLRADVDRRGADHADSAISSR